MKVKNPIYHLDSIKILIQVYMENMAYPTLDAPGTVCTPNKFQEMDYFGYTIPGVADRFFRQLVRKLSKK